MSKIDQIKTAWALAWRFFSRLALHPMFGVYSVENSAVACMERAFELHETNKQLLNNADEQGRELTAAEGAQFDKNLREIENLERRRASLERDYKFHPTGSGGRGRLSEPGPLPNDGIHDSMPPARSAFQSGGGRVSGTMGYEGPHAFGAFAQDVYQAGRNGGRPSAQFTRILNDASTYAGEDSGSDGGYAVPPDFRQEIIKKVFSEENLSGMCDQYTTARNVLTFPFDPTSPWESTAGVQANWEGEAAKIPQSKPYFEQRTVKLNKIVSLVPVTEELLSDTGVLDIYLRRKMAEVIDFKISDSIINGSGVGMPLGLLNSPSLLTVAKDANQIASTITGSNVNNLWASMYAPCRKNAVWIINQDAQSQLDAMFTAIPNRANTDTVAGWPLYVPSGGLSSAPYDTLKGKRIIYSQSAQMLGSTGDIILADLSKYVLGVKSYGLLVDTSIHIWFDQAITAFRVLARVGGEPWWMTPIASKNDPNFSLGWACALAPRA